MMYIHRESFAHSNKGKIALLFVSATASMCQTGNTTPSVHARFDLNTPWFEGERGAG